MRRDEERLTRDRSDLVTSLADYKLAYIQHINRFGRDDLVLIIKFLRGDKLSADDKHYIQELLRGVNLSFVPTYPWDEVRHGFIKKPDYYIQEEDPLNLPWQVIDWTDIVCRQRDVHKQVVRYYKNHFLQGHLVKPSTAYFDNDKGIWVITNGTHRIRALWEIIFQDGELPVLPVADGSRLTVAVTTTPPCFVNGVDVSKLEIKN